MKVCAVVVTYNRKELLMDCLEALLKQKRPLDAIYIVDNASTDGTPGSLQEKGYIDDPDGSIKTIEDHGGNPVKIVYVRMKENTGGAGGFHEGIRRAHTEGYDWIWVMDDDVEPLDDTLEKLLRAAEKIPEDVSAVAPVRFFRGSLFNLETKTFDFRNPLKHFTYNVITEDDLNEEYFRVAAISFEGPLIRGDAIERIGYPDRDLFIIADDTDYAIRLQTYGSIYMISGDPPHQKGGWRWWIQLEGLLLSAEPGIP
ncbi:MAG: hypothetical protein PWP32_1659 [Methanothermobacter sp.]|jgi:GT2 family glycosyltransferase|nr:hypothetical protein [Methanothermobacter sp.]